MLMTNVTSHPKDSLWDCVVTRAKCLKWQELRFHRWNAPLLSSNGEEKCFFNYWKIIWLRACFWEPLLAGYRKSMFGGWLALATYLGDLPAIDPGYSPIDPICWKDFTKCSAMNRCSSNLEVRFILIILSFTAKRYFIFLRPFTSSNIGTCFKLYSHTQRLLEILQTYYK